MICHSRMGYFMSILCTYQKLICKQNVHCELMLVKNALYPHEDVLKIEFLKQCGYKIS